jgi:hypothetical protein
MAGATGGQPSWSPHYLRLRKCCFRRGTDYRASSDEASLATSQFRSLHQPVPFALTMPIEMPLILELENHPTSNQPG